MKTTTNLRTALRSITRNKVYSSINLLGLTIGLASCMIVATVVIDEFLMTGNGRTATGCTVSLPSAKWATACTTVLTRHLPAYPSG
jgi:hypothetical protein